MRRAIRKRLILIGCWIISLFLVACALKSSAVRSIEIPNPSLYDVAWNAAIHEAYNMGYYIQKKDRIHRTILFTRKESSGEEFYIRVTFGRLAELGGRTGAIVKSWTGDSNAFLYSSVSKDADKMNSAIMAALREKGSRLPVTVSSHKEMTSIPMIVSVAYANVRQQPTINARIVTMIPRGTIVTKIGDTGNWIKVELPSKEQGWIYQDLLSLQRTQKTNINIKRLKGEVSTPKTKIKRPSREVKKGGKTITVIERCEIKTGPGAFYPKLENVSQGARLKATGNKTGDWIEVRVKNGKGYVYKDFVR